MRKHQEKEFDKILSLLKRDENFSLARFADGEQLFIEGKSAVGIDGWRSPNGRNSLGDALLNALEKAQTNDCIVGISDDVTNPASKHFYADILNRAKAENVTCSNIFVNGTYHRFKTEMCEQFKKKDNIHIVCSHDVNLKNISISFNFIF